MNDRKRPDRSLTQSPRSADYDVGYGKPPVASRFKPGQSGNPRGSLKRAVRKVVPALNDERLKTLILEEAYRTISINDQNGQLDIPMAQAVVRSLAVNAAKGNQRAQRLFTQLLSSVERDNKRLHDEWLQTAIDYKTSWDQELQRRKALGIEAPAPIPHPDHIIIDMNSGSVRITGPMTKEDKVKWDSLREHRREIEASIDELTVLLQSEPSLPEQKIIASEVAHSERVLKMITAVIDD